MMKIASVSGEVKGASESYLISFVLIGLGLSLVIGVGVVFWRQDLYN